jgi:hypothetical protein
MILTATLLLLGQRYHNKNNSSTIPQRVACRRCPFRAFFGLQREGRFKSCLRCLAAKGLTSNQRESFFMPAMIFWAFFCGTIGVLRRNCVADLGMGETVALQLDAQGERDPSRLNPSPARSRGASCSRSSSGARRSAADSRPRRPCCPRPRVRIRRTAAGRPARRCCRG